MLLEVNDIKKTAEAVARFSSIRSPNEEFRNCRLYTTDNLLWIEVHGPHGSGKASLCEVDEELDATVDCSTFIRALGQSRKGDQISLSVKGNKLTIGKNNSKISLFLKETSKRSVFRPVDQTGVLVDSTSLTECLSRVMPMIDSAQIKYENGQRLVTEDSELYAICGSASEWAGAWCECEGDEIDISIPEESSRCLNYIAKSSDGPITLRDYQGRMLVATTDNGLFNFPVLSGGKKPMLKSKCDSFLNTATEWRIDQNGLKEFLEQASMFVTPMSNGVWLRPMGDNLLCEYLGQPDGEHAAGDFSVAGNCQMVVEGECDGEDVYISSKSLKTAIHPCPEDAFRMLLVGSGVFLDAERYRAGISRRHAPSGD